MTCTFITQLFLSKERKRIKKRIKTHNINKKQHYSSEGYSKYPLKYAYLVLNVKHVTIWIKVNFNYIYSEKGGMLHFYIH